MTATPQPTANDLRAWLAGQFLSAAKRTAADLRDLADTIERRAHQINAATKVDTIRGGDIAAQIVSDVTGGLANAGLSAVVSAAARFDTETKSGPPAQPSPRSAARHPEMIPIKERYMK